MSQNMTSIVHDFIMESDIPLTLSDPRLPDEPMILANDAFYKMTGYSAEETLGKNCRFMQGKGTQKSSRNTIKGDFAANRDTKVLIRNYRKSGEVFDNFLYIFTVFDGTDEPLFRIGSQFEVPNEDRAKAFKFHASTLMNTLTSVNEQVGLSRHQLIDISELAGASVKLLLMARLENLRSN